MESVTDGSNAHNAMGIKKESSDTRTTNCTRAQEGLYVLHCINPENPAYNVSCTFRFLGQINVAALEKSIRAVVNRHEVLRTSFRLEVDGLKLLTQATQDNQTSLNFKFLHQQSIPAKLTSLQQQDVLNNQINQPFDLHKPPLFRCTLFSTDAFDEHLFVFVAHHTVFDHLSKSILYFEISEFYNHFAHAKALNLTGLTYQYSDYVNGCEQRLQGTAIARQKKYWSKQLKNIEPVGLLLDHDREPMPSSEGVRLELPLPGESIVAVREMAREQQASFFMAMLAVFKILLSLWTGSKDISVGTHNADRAVSGSDQVIGFLLNTLVLRTAVDEKQDFYAVLKAVQKTCFNAYRFSDISFEQLVEDLHDERNYQRNPFFDARFSHLVDSEYGLNLEGVEVEGISLKKCRARYDLTFTVRENADQCFIQAEYRSSLFEKSKIDWLLHKYVSLLEILVNKPTVKLQQLSLIDDQLKHTLTLEYNDTFQRYPSDKTIDELIAFRSNSAPESVVVRFEGAQLTYQELELRSDKLAVYLQQSGITLGVVVAISLPRSLELVIATLAVLKTGAAYLPIDHEYPEDRIAHMIRDSNAGYVISHSDLQRGFSETSATILLFDEKQVEINQLDENELVAPEGLNSDSTAYLIYTSGSTGRPKGVSVTHKNVVNFLCSMQSRPGLTENDRLVAVTTLSFDIAVLEIWLPLVCGATCILASREDAINGECLSQLLRTEKATVMQATPVTWRMLISAGWRGNKDFKALCGGEAMPPDLSDELRLRTGELWNMYGPTETTVWSSCFQVSGSESRIPIGKPIDNTCMYILNEQKQLVYPGAIGQLYIGGSGVSLGYLGREELTREKFIPNPFNAEDIIYATGDAARYRSDGNIECLSRLDNQVKVRGHRIELGEIEAQMNAHPAVKQALATVLSDPNGDQRIVACFETNEPASELMAELRDSLKKSLPLYMVPQNLLHLDKLPLTPNGKLDRKSEVISLSDDVDTTSSFEPTQTRLEQAVAAIWADVLQLEAVPVNQTFFDLGGHSLLAMQVLSRIKKELRIKIDPVAMASSTIRELLVEFDDEVVEVTDTKDSHALTTMKTFYFSHDELYARLHEPSKPRGARGAVLLCNSIFTEANNIAWAYHRLGSLLAAEGYYVLRFDYYGCGNSLGEDEDGTLERWQRDISSAAQKLVELSGFNKVSVVGFRYGATLAASLAASVAGVSVDKFVLWEPVTDSRDYIRQFEDRYLNAINNPAGFQKNTLDDSALEILGFHYPEPMRRSLEKLELTAGSLLSTCASLHLVTNDHSAQFVALAEKLNSVSKRLSVKEVNDNILPIQNYDDLLAWLPGKSVFQIVKSIVDNENA